MFTLCCNVVKYVQAQSAPGTLRYVLIGLNNAGKTTIASALSGGARPERLCRCCLFVIIRHPPGQK